MANFHKEPEFVITSQALLQLRSRRESFSARKGLGPGTSITAPKHQLYRLEDPNLYFSETSHQNMSQIFGIAACE